MTFHWETIGMARGYAEMAGLAVANPDTGVRVLYEVDLQTIVAQTTSLMPKR